MTQRTNRERPPNDAAAGFRVSGGYYTRDMPITDAERARHARQRESAVLVEMNQAARALWRR